MKRPTSGSAHSASGTSGYALPVLRTAPRLASEDDQELLPPARGMVIATELTPESTSMPSWHAISGDVAERSLILLERSISPNIAIGGRS